MLLIVVATTSLELEEVDVLAAVALEATEVDVVATTDVGDMLVVSTSVVVVRAAAEVVSIESMERGRNWNPSNCTSMVPSLKAATTSATVCCDPTSVAMIDPSSKLTSATPLGSILAACRAAKMAPMKRSARETLRGAPKISENVRFCNWLSGMVKLTVDCNAK